MSCQTKRILQRRVAFLKIETRGLFRLQSSPGYNDPLDRTILNYWTLYAVMYILPTPVLLITHFSCININIWGSLQYFYCLMLFMVFIYSNLLLILYRKYCLFDQEMISREVMYNFPVPGAPYSTNSISNTTYDNTSRNKLNEIDTSSSNIPEKMNN